MSWCCGLGSILASWLNLNVDEKGSTSLVQLPMWPVQRVRIEWKEETSTVTWVVVDS